jgi:hypothetical protein
MKFSNLSKQSKNTPIPIYPFLAKLIRPQNFFRRQENHAKLLFEINTAGTSGRGKTGAFKIFLLECARGARGYCLEKRAR